MVFFFVWSTIVYDPIACWTWNPNGWLFKLPSLDFAGGGPVHISSGWSALAYALVLGKRKHHGEKSHGKPHNTTLVFLGTVLIWFGWFGFNVSPFALPIADHRLTCIGWFCDQRDNQGYDGGIQYQCGSQHRCPWLGPC